MNSNFRLTYDRLDVGDVYAIADHARNGAVVLMSGMVRNQTGGRAVDYLDYQAYESMALQVFQDISDHAVRNFLILLKSSFIIVLASSRLVKLVF